VRGPGGRSWVTVCGSLLSESIQDSFPPRSPPPLTDENVHEMGEGGAQPILQRVEPKYFDWSPWCFLHVFPAPFVRGAPFAHSRGSRITWYRLKIKAEKLRNARTNWTVNPNSPKNAQM
jgi:hypothetical protein